jgi:hypothetical protein
MLQFSHILIQNKIKYKPLIIGLACLFGELVAFSQEKVSIQLKKITFEDFNLPKSQVIDSNTNAVILADVGSTFFVGSKNHNWVSAVIRAYTRIKIIKQSALDLATVKIPLHETSNGIDILDSLQASAYNVESGRLVETKLNLNEVFENKINRYTIEKRFSLAAVKEGSIIEYSYQITSPNYQILPSWRFQHFEYPCLHSEYEIIIPNLLSYHIVYYGKDPFLLNESEKMRNQYYKMATVNVKTEATRHRWVMKELPPFEGENFINTPNDCLDKIEFHLAQSYNGENIQNYSSSWKNTTHELLQRDDFGYAIGIEKSSFLLKDVKKLVSDGENLLDASKSIYNYVRDNFTCTSRDYITVQSSLYDIYKTRKGSAAEINLLLIAMLRQNGMAADPVILGTKEYGTNSSEYPVMDKINYVICATWIYGDTIYLDASRPTLGFGRLPLDCYNGHARIINDKETGPLFFYPDGIKEPKMTTVFISNNEKGKISGTFQSDPGFFGSEEIREKISNTGKDKFIEGIKSAYSPETIITNTGIDSLKQIEFPIHFHYDFTFPYEANEDIFYFSPIIGEVIKDNPFKAVERKFPVEMPYPVDDLYVLNMEIPEGYIVDELPKSAKVAFNENEGYFEYMIAHDEGTIQLRTHLKLNKATFPPEEYKTLRDFWTYVIKKQGEAIVFKKKK